MNFRYILGIQSFANQDSGACIVRFDEDGQTLDYVAISEERLIRKKYPYTFPIHSLGYCLDFYGLKGPNEVDLLVADFIRLKRWFRSGPGYNCSDYDYLKLKLDIAPGKIVQISHHMAHAASTYYTSGFEDAAILIVDGNGSDLQTTSFLEGKGNKIRYLDSYHARGIGNAYSAVTNWILNLGTGGEGKTMGLAPFGEPYDPVIDFQAEYDGISTNYAKFMRRMPLSDVLNQMGEANRINPLRKHYRKRQKDELATEPYFARAAYDIQAEAEKAMVHLGQDLYRRSSSDNICLAGGVALNSVANKIMFEASDFQKICVFPACSDTGIPFGLAIWGYYNAKELGSFQRIPIDFRNAYSGIEYSQNRIDEVISRQAIRATRTTPKEVAHLIADGNIIGWFQGGSEYGPRALGHRSILADSRREEMKDILNLRVKHRETYRPFAPAVLLEDCADYFDFEGESPYMLLVTDVKKPDLVPAITHIDKTARLQTVTQENNGLFYDLIAAFKEITNVPVILNTSFNDAGEPIVETPEDAIICFLSNDIDYLVLGNQLICADEQDRDIAVKMRTERDNLILRKKDEYIARFFPGYDPGERDTYIEAENSQAVWNVTQKARYDLEKQILAWKKHLTRVMIVGTSDHTQVIYRKVNGMSDLKIVGFIPFGNWLDDPDLYECREEDICYPVLSWEMLRQEDIYDTILISSHEYMFEILEALEKEELSKPKFEIYDNTSRSLIMVTKDSPAFPPR